MLSLHQPMIRARGLYPKPPTQCLLIYSSVHTIYVTQIDIRCSVLPELPLRVTKISLTTWSSGLDLNQRPSDTGNINKTTHNQQNAKFLGKNLKFNVIDRNFTRVYHSAICEPYPRLNYTFRLRQVELNPSLKTGIWFAEQDSNLHVQTS